MTADAPAETGSAETSAERLLVACMDGRGRDRRPRAPTRIAVKAPSAIAIAAAAQNIGRMPSPVALRSGSIPNAATP